MVFEHVTIKIDIGVSSFSDNPICLVLLLFWTQNRWRLKKKILETKWCQKMKLYPPNPRHVATSSLGAVLSHRSSAWQSGQCDGMRWHMHDGHLSYRVWNCPSQPCRIRGVLGRLSHPWPHRISCGWNDRFLRIFGSQPSHPNSFSRSQPSRNLPALWCFEPLAASCASWWCEDPENVSRMISI